jgi:hypothetical protein
MYVLSGLKVFFDEVIDLYKRFFKKTYSSAFLVSVYGGLLTAVLYLLSKENGHSRTHDDFFSVYFYNSGGSGPYVLTDLAIIIFMTVIALSAISLHPSRNNGEQGSSLSFVKGLNSNDFWNVILACLFACAADFVFNYVYSLQFDSNGPEGISRVVLFKRLIYYTRAYFPVVIIAIAVYRSVYPDANRMNRRILAVLIISAWLTRGISLHFFSLFDNLILYLPHAIVPDRDTVFVINIFTCLPFLAMLVPGYMAVMYLPGLLAENGFLENVIEDDETEQDPKNDESLNEVETMYPFED